MMMLNITLAINDDVVRKHFAQPDVTVNEVLAGYTIGLFEFTDFVERVQDISVIECYSTP